MRFLRFIRGLFRLLLGGAFIAMGVLAIVGVDSLPVWPFAIPGAAIILSGVALFLSDRAIAFGESRRRMAAPHTPHAGPSTSPMPPMPPMPRSPQPQ